MRKTIVAALAGVALSAGAALAADGADPAGFDLVFRKGTLDALPGAATLVYARDVAEGGPEGEPIGGAVELELVGAAADGGDAVLRLVADDGQHAIGTFPAAVGNPVAMYFMETVIRDMAETAGGSPFYIRNRIKDALFAPAGAETVEASYRGEPVLARRLVLRPFQDDPNRDRMQGFGALALTLTMSEQVPGWYLSLSAEVPGADGAPPLYESRLALRAVQTEGQQ
ncbi:hypothetical protein SAMN05444722_2403 [Rhodovulum sp. ES.010]|uniref:hypothetical protein n=1 Tax=Rhodovulum sp. ES.010 TaxID=1882821 RepID=UPI000929E44C|nr:hypothetical protein [Rhodovulum sp. ES.010]SIO47373.1 hypothetical protein SAMN05444722_2403 [Rhodovulum sp. ES.010]